MKRSTTWLLGLGMLLVMAVSPAARADDPKGEFSVHQMSLWVIDSAGGMANSRAAFASPLPGAVFSGRNTNLPNQAGVNANLKARMIMEEEQELMMMYGGDPMMMQMARTAAVQNSVRPMAPAGLLTFHGKPTSKIDVELKLKKGAFMSQWPSGENMTNRVRWQNTPPYELVDKLEEDSSLAYVDSLHWIRKARDIDGLIIRHGVRSEKFLAFDAETEVPQQVKVEISGDKCTLINLTGLPLYDVLITRSTPQGRAIAWIDELAADPNIKPPVLAAQPQRTPEPANNQGQRRPGRVGRVPVMQMDGPMVDGPFGPQFLPGDIMNEINQAIESGEIPPEALNEIMPEIQRMQMQMQMQQFQWQMQAQQLVDPMPGGVPVPDMAVQPPAAPGAKPAGPEVPKAEATAEAAKTQEAPARPQAPPKPPGSHRMEVTFTPGDAASATKTLAARLAKAGLTPREAEVFVETNRALFMTGDEIAVVCRMDPVVIQQNLTLSILPQPEEVLSVPLMVSKHSDPRLVDEVDRLIARLGDVKYSEREAAQKRLLQLGSVAVPQLQKAISSNDPEVVIRAERILLTQNVMPGAPATPNRPNPAIPPVQTRPAILPR